MCSRCNLEIVLIRAFHVPSRAGKYGCVILCHTCGMDIMQYMRLQCSSPPLKMKPVWHEILKWLISNHSRTTDQ